MFSRVATVHPALDQVVIGAVLAAGGQELVELLTQRALFLVEGCAHRKCEQILADSTERRVIFQCSAQRVVVVQAGIRLAGFDRQNHVGHGLKLEDRRVRVGLGGVGFVGRPEEHGDFSAIQVGARGHLRLRCRFARCRVGCRRLAREQHHRYLEIGRREIDPLTAFLGGGHAVDDRVELSGLQRRQQGHEGHVVKFDRPTEFHAQQSGDVRFVTGGPPVGIHEDHGLARGSHTHAQRDARGRHGDVDFVIGLEACLEPAAMGGLQRAVLLEFADGVIDLRQQCCVSLAHGHRGVIRPEWLGENLQCRVFLGHQVGGRESGHDHVKLPGIQGRHSVHHVLEGVELGLRKALSGDCFAGRAGHHADPGVRGIVDGPDVHGRLVAAGQDQCRAHEGCEQPCLVCHPRSLEFSRSLACAEVPIHQ